MKQFTFFWTLLTLCVLYIVTGMGSMYLAVFFVALFIFNFFTLLKEEFSKLPAPRLSPKNIGTMFVRIIFGGILGCILGVIIFFAALIVYNIATGRTGALGMPYM